MWEKLLPELINIGGALVAGLLSLVALEVRKWLQAKVKNEMLNGLLGRLNDTVFSVVAELNQTVVKEIRSRSEDGKLTSEEQTAVKDIAVMRAKELFGDAARKSLGDVLGISADSVNSLFSSKVETFVAQSKQGR